MKLICLKLAVSDDGNFKLVLGQDDISANNYLHMPSQANMLIVRQTYSRRVSQKHAVVNITKVGKSSDPELLTNDDLNKHLKQSLAFVKGTAQTFLGWVHDFKKES